VEENKIFIGLFSTVMKWKQQKEREEAMGLLAIKTGCTRANSNRPTDGRTQDCIQLVTRLRTQYNNRYQPACITTIQQAVL
jgi:hypothetical protein